MKPDLRRILIVDDCDEDREYAKRLLSKAAEFTWQFAEAPDGKQGLALAVSGGPFDCILVDYRLRDMDGLEFLELLPKQFGEPGVAAVMLTGEGDEALAVRAMKLGAQDYLSKRRLDAELLRRAVENAIRHFQLILANRQSAELLEAAHRELEAFTYSVSHDLRAPLRHIAGFSGILLHDYGPGMELKARDLLQRIADAVVHMGLLVDGLLSLSKLGRQSLKLVHADLNAIVDEAISILQPECEGRVVEWRIARLPALECDKTLIAQVFQNLISNALKYSRGRASTFIEIGSIQEPGKPAIIFVRDNGAGFDMTRAEKLFDVFQRMHTESEFEGTGLGLAIAKRIISRHGGRIWAEAAIDAGATFSFTLAEPP
jgi:light-regulated signal transduction histidine kinase (bacteriophytochrome)